MVARKIEYAELYVGDIEANERYFVDAMKFRPVARADDHENRSVLLRQGTIDLVLTSGPATEEFRRGHGDGIADIALSCDDVQATRAAALAAGAAGRGAPRGNPAVGGFGSVVHTLLPAGVAGSLPPGFGWTATGASGENPGLGMHLLDHVAVCVEAGGLDAYADLYARGFGMARYSSESVRVGDSSMDSVVVRNPDGGVTFTLVAPGPDDARGQLAAFLERNGGPGVQHLAFLVDDIVSAVRAAQGVDFLSAPGVYYEMLADRFIGMSEEISELRATNVLADRDEWGYLLQLFTRSPHPRQTLFYEFIQRRGSRGFGSNNIRALYEAVELDRLTAP